MKSDTKIMLSETDAIIFFIYLVYTITGGTTLSSHASAYVSTTIQNNSAYNFLSGCAGDLLFLPVPSLKYGPF